MILVARVFFLGVFFCVAFFSVSQQSFAATLYIDPHSVDVLKGDTVTAAVRLDTDEGECVNTVDAVISYGEDIQAIDISRGRSILSLWVEDPIIKKDEHQITFAGGIPNGYCGRIPGDPSLTNIVAELVFRAPGFSVGQSENITSLLTFEPGTRVLLNDGFGTEATLRTISGSINLLQSVGTTSKDVWRDIVLQDAVQPQPFSIDLVQNPDVFSGKYYIVFNTTDKQSGIDHYEIIEESRDDIYSLRWGRGDAPWAPIESPYVLEDQSLSSIIRVKAVDKAGNERITVFIPDDSMRRMQGVTVALLVGIGSLLSLALVAAFWMVFRKKRIHKKSEITEL